MVAVTGHDFFLLLFILFYFLNFFIRVIDLIFCATLFVKTYAIRWLQPQTQIIYSQDLYLLFLFTGTTVRSIIIKNRIQLGGL